MIKTITLYCGSNQGVTPRYSQQVKQLGQALAQAKLNLVYGGANVGLMGVIANSMLDAGRHVTGVLPKDLCKREIAHNHLNEFIQVDSMHQRKMIMYQKADAFILMPGGFGSLDEFFEILTWMQLGHHQKPCAIFNIDNYYDSLLEFIDHSVNQGFVAAEHQHNIIVDNCPKSLIKKLLHYKIKTASKWAATTR